MASESFMASLVIATSVDRDAKIPRPTRALLRPLAALLDRPSCARARTGGGIET